MSYELILKLWAATAPDECWRNGAIFNICIGRHPLKGDVRYSIGTIDGPELPADDLYIQGAVQHAIKARGWDWGKMRNNVVVQTNAKIPSPNYTITIKEGEPFSIGLLAAYLSALTKGK